MTSQFLAIRLRPADRDIPRGGTAASRLLALAEWPPCADEPTGYWLSTLPADTPIEELIRLAEMRWRIEHDYRESSTAWAWATSKAAPTSAGTATSPSPPSPRRSAP